MIAFKLMIWRIPVDKKFRRHREAKCGRHQMTFKALKRKWLRVQAFDASVNKWRESFRNRANEQQRPPSMALALLILQLYLLARFCQRWLRLKFSFKCSCQFIAALSFCNPTKNSVSTQSSGTVSFLVRGCTRKLSIDTWATENSRLWQKTHKQQLTSNPWKANLPRWNNIKKLIRGENFSVPEKHAGLDTCYDSPLLTFNKICRQLKRQYWTLPFPASRLEGEKKLHSNQKLEEREKARM